MSRPQRVLVIDDELPIHRFLSAALTASGYEPVQALTGAEGLHLLATAVPEIVLLDLGLPDMDGKDVIVRARGFSPVPIIVLSARDREAEKIAALDLGADDFVNKPFGVGELLARVRAALRPRMEESGKTAVYRAGGLEVDVPAHRVLIDGAPVRLTPREFDLLAFLARHAGKVVTHRQILKSVWGPAHEEDTQYLRVYVGQLRAKLESDPNDPVLILTEPGIGYRLSL